MWRRATRSPRGCAEVSTTEERQMTSPEETGYTRRSQWLRRGTPARAPGEYPFRAHSSDDVSRKALDDAQFAGSAARPIPTSGTVPARARSDRSVVPSTSDVDATIRPSPVRGEVGNRCRISSLADMATLFDGIPSTRSRLHDDQRPGGHSVLLLRRAADEAGCPIGSCAARVDDILKEYHGACLGLSYRAPLRSS